MALSGSFYSNVRTGWRLQAEWSATQNIAANQSTVTVKLYWISLGSSWVINSSASKSGSIVIEGTTYAFSGAGLADLNGNQKRLISTASKTITHASNGTMSALDIQCNFNPDVSLSGSNPGNVRISNTYALNTIPRSSTISSSANWTAGNDLSVSISRASSSFTHKVRVYVDGVLISDKTGVTTSTKFAFTAAEDELIFSELAGGTSKASRIEIDTMNGSTKIGSTASKTGTVTAPNASTLSSSADFYIGAPLSLNISRANASFTHTVKVYVGSALIRTMTGIGTSFTYDFTATEINNMYNQTTSSNSVATKIEVLTYMGSKQVRSTTSKAGTAKVANSNPTFGTGFTYQDTNAATKALTGNTGNDGLIVQGKSNVQVTLPSSAFATPKNGATIKQYVATLNGKEKLVNAPFSNPVLFDLGTVAAESNLTLSVKAVDSRNNSVTSIKVVKIVPYIPPVINASVTRVSNYEVTTTIKTNGSVSLLEGKNSLSNLQYRYRELVTGATWSALANITRTTTGANFTGNNVSLQLDNTKAYEFEIIATDKLGNTTITKTVASGKPIWFVDTVKKSVGVGMFPTDAEQLQVEGKITTRNNLGTIELNGRDFKVDGKRLMVGLPSDELGNRIRINYGGEFTNGTQIDGDVQLTNGKITFKTNGFADQGTKGEALELNNSDIFGCNNIWFHDGTGTDEGLMFPHSTTPNATRDASKYDTFRILDQRGFLNNDVIFMSGDRVLFTSTGVYMHGTQDVKPTKKIHECPNGWVLVWSRYASGTGQNDHWQYTYINKEHTNGGSIQCPIFAGNTLTHKYVYVLSGGSVLQGHTDNDAAPAASIVLRYVWAF